VYIKSIGMERLVDNALPPRPRAAVAELGLGLFSPNPAASVTAVRLRGGTPT
jgi:hypothetical protein